MKFLLDTHIWLWSLLTPERLSDKVQTVLQDSQHLFFLSPITIWETLILAEKQRIMLSKPPLEWLHEALGKSLVREAPLTHAIAIKSRTILLPHEDPADRFIAATALEYKLILITEDKYLKQSSHINIFE